MGSVPPLALLHRPCYFLLITQQIMQITMNTPTSQNKILTMKSNTQSMMFRDLTIPSTTSAKSQIMNWPNIINVSQPEVSSCPVSLGSDPISDGWGG
jgi:hypothetical protein